MPKHILSHQIEAVKREMKGIRPRRQGRETFRPGMSPGQVRKMEGRFPGGFVLKTKEGEFQFTPGSERFEEGRIRHAVQRVPERQFIPKNKKIFSN